MLDLEPVSYRSLCARDDPDRINYGLIAEQAAAVDPGFTHWLPPVGDEHGPLAPEGVQYDRLVVHLISIVKRLKAALGDAVQRIETLEAA